MSEIAKKKIRYELLEQVEEYLNSKIESFRRDIEYNTNPDNWNGNEEIPEWRLDENRKMEARIKEAQDIIKGLLKL